MASGNAHRMKVQVDRAIPDFVEAIRLDLRHGAAFIGRAQAYALKGVLPGGGIADYDLAIADCNEGIRLDPKNANALYGRAALGSGGYPRAT